MIMLLLAALAGPLDDPQFSDRACGSSRDQIVHAQILKPHMRAVEQAVRKWTRWMERHAGDFCFTLVLSPGNGSDGYPIRLPMLIVFRLLDHEAVKIEPGPPVRHQTASRGR